MSYMRQLCPINNNILSLGNVSRVDLSFSFSPSLFATVHALSRACTVTCENPIPNRFAMGFSPFHSVFSRKSRKKRLEFRGVCTVTKCRHRNRIAFYNWNAKTSESGQRAANSNRSGLQGIFADCFPCHLTRNLLKFNYSERQK